MSLILKILSGLLAVLGLLGSMEVIPFLEGDLGLFVAGLGAGVYGVVKVIGDYLDNKKLDGSFKEDDKVKSIVGFFLNFFKKK